MTVTIKRIGTVSLCANATFSSVDISIFQYLFYFINGYLPAIHSASRMFGKDEMAGISEIFMTGIGATKSFCSFYY